MYTIEGTQIMNKTTLFIPFFIAVFLLVSCKATIPNSPSSSSTRDSSQSRHPPRIDSFEAFPAMFTQGDAIDLNWETSHATEVHISGVGRVNNSGSHHINNISVDQADIILTASNNGNFSPDTERLNMQVVLMSISGPVPDNFKGPRDKPVLILGNRATINNKINRYKLRPIDKSMIRDHRVQTVTPRPAANSSSMQIKPMIATPMHYNIAQPGIPKLLSPANNSSFRHFPRTLKLKWRSVSNATSYNVEIDCMHCCASGKWCTDVGGKYKQLKGIRRTYYQFNFVGSQPGRWRVQAVDKNGKKGQYSHWNNFSFSK